MPNLLESAWLRLLSAKDRESREAALLPLLESLRKSAQSLELSDLPDFSPRPVSLPRADDPFGESATTATASAASIDPAFRPFLSVTRERTAAELTGYLLQVAESSNPKWNAFSKIHGAEALAAARQVDTARSTGRPWGPLHGIPFGIKDNISVKGWPHTASSKILGQAVAAEDATVITRLRNSGAFFLGQTIMHELAFGMTSINPHLGPVRNPWDRERICGGSSGGSAAVVAAGMVPVALGSDTGGSVRCPATLCGLAGFKPSFGAVSRYGVTPLGGSLDTVGPIAHTAAQCLAVHQAIAGEDPRDPATLGTAGLGRREAPKSLGELRIGLPRPYFTGAMEPGIRKQVNLAVEKLQKAGARVENIQFPDLDAVNAAASLTLLVEAAGFFGPYLPQGKDIGEDVRGRFEQGLLIPGQDFMQAQRLRALWKRQVAALFAECDLLLTPTSPVAPPKIDDPYTELDGARVDARTAVSRYLRSFNFLGLPALTLPCGLDDLGLPVGIQLVGPGFSDEWVLRAGMLMEPVLGFDAKPPKA